MAFSSELVLSAPSSSVSNRFPSSPKLRQDGPPSNQSPESDTQEYRCNLERLDQVLVNIEKYIHFAFAAAEEGGGSRRGCSKWSVDFTHINT